MNTAPQSESKPAAKKETPPAVDAYGDPLPAGAVARLGTVRFRHQGWATKLVFSRDGKVLAGYSQSGVHIWEAATGKSLRRFTGGVPMFSQSLDISPDGTTVAFGVDDLLNKEMQINVCDIRTGKEIRSFSISHLSGNIFPIRFTPDGKALALLNNGRLVVLELASGQVQNSAISGDMFNLAFAADGRTLATGGGKALQLWDFATGNKIRSIDRPEGALSAFSFSADGKMLALSNEDCIAICDPMTWKELHYFGKKLGVFDLAFTPDGKSLVWAGWVDGKVHVWDIAAGKIRQTFDGDVAQPDARDFTGNTIAHGRCMALSPDGKTVALGSNGSTVKLWALDSGKELFTKFDGHESLVNCLAFLPDGKTLISAGDLPPIRLWDTTNWKQTRVVQGSASVLSLSPNGKRLATIPGHGTMLRLWDLASSKDPLALTIADTEEITQASFSTDGRKFLSLDRKIRKIDKQSSEWEPFTLRLWDSASGKQEPPMDAAARDARGIWRRGTNWPQWPERAVGRPRHHSAF